MTGHMNITHELAHARRVEMVKRAERDRLVRMAEVATEPEAQAAPRRRHQRLGWLLPSRHATA
jgi:hypothetical protein